MFESGYAPIASHIVFPSFMDDRVEAERQAGIDMPWVWQLDVPHHFFIDLGTSTGMKLGRERCVELGIEVVDDCRLPPRHMQAFYAGELPPHTPGFEL